MIQSFFDYFRNVDWAYMSRLAGLSLLVIVGQIVFYNIVVHFFKKKVFPFIADRSRHHFNGIKFRGYAILTPARLLTIGFFTAKTVLYTILALSFYTSLTLLFVIHPGTRNFAYKLVHAILDPLLSILHGFIAYTPNLLRIAIIVAVTHYLLKFVKFIMSEIENKRLIVKGFYPDWAHATLNLFRFLGYAFMLVLIFPLLPDSETSAFKGVSVFFGVLLSLGSTTVIANLIAGFVLTYMRSFKLGDRVKVGEVLGDVVEKTPFAVRIQTSKKEIVTVPNGTILSSNVVNFSTNADAEERNGVILYMDVTVCYDVPWRKAIELLTAAALKTEFVMETPAPFVNAKNLDNDASIMELNIYTQYPELQPKIFSDLNKNIRDLFEGEGISLTVPRLVSLQPPAVSVAQQPHQPALPPAVSRQV
ncbi:hypothetical protein AGMMS49938_09660 [Fibrobacterales bacterium]|nr:hypothetical protein AGMMS49938_09660 [Fibrobacterales bacterium]